MWKQFQLSIGDLNKRKTNSLLLFLQTTVILILIQFVIISLVDLKQMVNEVERLNYEQEIYYLIDATDKQKFDSEILNGEKINELDDLYEYIFNNSKFQAFSLYKGGITFQEIADPLEFLYTSNLFNTYFDIRMAEGRYFQELDYTQKADYIPIILGNNYQGEIEIGEILQNYYSEQKYEIIGILEDNMSYIDIKSSRDFQNLNDMILLPVNPHNFTSEIDYAMVVEKTYIIPDNRNDMYDILNYAGEQDTYSFLFRSMEEQLEFVVKDKMKWIQTQIFLIGLVSTVTFVSFTVSFLQTIEKNLYEYGVHYLSGATHKDIGTRIAFQIIPFLIFGNIGRMLFLWNMEYGIHAFSISIGLGILVCIIPLLKINKLNLDTMLRWRIR